MSWSTVCVTPSFTTRLVVLFCLFWPLVALTWIRVRGQSSAPIAAMCVALAVATTAVWLGLSRVVQGMALSGGGRAASSAGKAEALSMVGIGWWSVLFLAILMLIRRHRPVADRGVVLIAALCFANVLAAARLAHALAPLSAHATLGYVGAGVSLVLAVTAATWLILVARDRVTPRPVPFAAAGLLLAATILGYLIWQWMHEYMAIAITG